MYSAFHLIQKDFPFKASKTELILKSLKHLCFKTLDKR